MYLDPTKKSFLQQMRRSLSKNKYKKRNGQGTGMLSVGCLCFGNKTCSGLYLEGTTFHIC